MTPSTYHPPLEGGEAPGMAKLAATILDCIACRMQITSGAVAKALAGSVWRTVAEMSAREFTSSYRGYYPKCEMAIREEAVIAQVFDQLAITYGDPRRAVRSGAWTPPATQTGGRSDG
ncbi:MAG: hypothetical protein Q4P24_07365 [Rhodobacterales bacterium]|nr:hypothetical protein [Rhodobacterales bacterium]